jgi:hypothetical protein
MNGAGFSLVEAMVSTALGAVVLGAALDTFVTHHQHYRLQQTKAELQQDLRGGVHLLSNELRKAGAAVLVGHPPVSVMAADEVAFDANVNDVRGWSAAAAASGQDKVQVTPHSGWVKGKRIVICGSAGCEEHILARDGTSGKLVLTDYLGRDYPASSRVEVVNRVRYYLSRRDPENGKLMREVDSGANPLVEHVESFSLWYLTGDGRPAGRVEEIKLIRLQLETSGPDGRGGRIRRALTQDVGVRAL